MAVILTKWQAIYSPATVQSSLAHRAEKDSPFNNYAHSVAVVTYGEIPCGWSKERASRTDWQQRDHSCNNAVISQFAPRLMPQHLAQFCNVHRPGNRLIIRDALCATQLFQRLIQRVHTVMTAISNTRIEVVRIAVFQLLTHGG